jgi:PIN domain nuclease of toxin-antitoxin system
MIFLVDTHAIIWFITDDKKLPKVTKELIENKEHTCYVSIASLWEIAIKFSLGRLLIHEELKNIFQTIEESGFEILPITSIHLLKIAELPFHHQDPFDRIIIAQSIVEDINVITKDEQYEKYQIKLNWK